MNVGIYKFNVSYDLALFIYIHQYSLRRGLGGVVLYGLHDRISVIDER